MKIKLYAFVFLIAFGFFIQAQSKEVEKSWSSAVVYLPGKLFSVSVDKISVDKPTPVVIYLHGCVGINKYQDANWASLLAEQGFIVILPDSFARPDRLRNCDPRLKTRTNAFPMVYEYRQQEITYTLSQVMASSWADKKNIFLMGHSEGGIAAAQSPHPEFAGKIISAWTCTDKKDPSFDGIFSPPNQPILAMASLDDEWRKGTAYEGRCADKALNRTNFKQIDRQGSIHSTYDNPDAQKAVKEFLKQYSTK
jgi:dienelactone hydrolase